MDTYLKEVVHFNLSVFRETCNEKLIDNIILFLVFQPNVTTDEYSFCFEALLEYVLEKNLTDYFVLLGDLLDANIHGTSGIYSFERRVNFYIRSGNISRQLSVLMLMHQKVSDRTLKERIEEQIIDMMEMKQTYSMADFRLLSTYSCMGVSKPLTSAFKHFQFVEVVASDSLLARELSRTYDELGAELRVTPFYCRLTTFLMNMAQLPKQSTNG